MSHMNSLYLAVQKLLPKFKIFATELQARVTDRHDIT